MIAKEMISTLSVESLAKEFFKQSEGEWYSQRRYYTLQQEGEPQEVVSSLKVEFLAQGTKELVELAKLHQLAAATELLFGTKVSWESNYPKESRKPSIGTTVFGIRGEILYRDRGFATNKPITATYYFPNPTTFCLRTEYNGSVFEEEIKLIGQNYRTRQTIISRAGAELMIGQYLEKRVNLV